MLQCNFGRVIPDDEIKATKTATNETDATNTEPTTTNLEPAVTVTSAPVTNTIESPVEDDKPKLPLWRAALKQKKEAEVKQKDEEQRKSVSSFLNA